VLASCHNSAPQCVIPGRLPPARGGEIGHIQKPAAANSRSAEWPPLAGLAQQTQMHLHTAGIDRAGAWGQAELVQAAMAATVADVAAIRSAGASSISSPRRPALQNTVG
jgi:hypothetical protein